MKKVLSIAIIMAFVAGMFTSCSNSEAVKTAQNYYKTLQAEDYDAIYDFFAPSVDEDAVAFIIALTQEALDSKDGLKSYEVVGPEVIDEDNPNLSQITVKAEYGDGSTDEQPITLYKESDGKYYVFMGE